MANLMDIQPVAPVPAPGPTLGPARASAGPDAGPVREGPVREGPGRASPAIMPSFRFVPSPAPMLGQRWLDTFEIARLYAEVAQRNLISGAESSRLASPASHVTSGEKARF